MTEVYRRKLALDKYTPTLTAVTLFYSRIILNKLTTKNKTTFRKLEKSVKFSVTVLTIKNGIGLKFKLKCCKMYNISPIKVALDGGTRPG